MIINRLVHKLQPLCVGGEHVVGLLRETGADWTIALFLRQLCRRTANNAPKAGKKPTLRKRGA